MLGLLISPVILSIFTFLYGVNAIRDVPVKRWLRNKWWLLGMVWIACYAITWFWSANKHHWGGEVQILLPVMLLPLAYIYMPTLSPRQLSIMNTGGSLILLGGISYSLSFLVRDPEHYILQYGVSHLLPVPCEKDHIRFSLAIVLFMIWCVYSWPQMPGKMVRWVVGISMAIMVVYLHILAAKIGIISLYLFFVCWGLYVTIARKKLAGLLIIIAVPVVMWLALNYVPTFAIRQQYIHYTLVKLEQQDKSGNYGDINRMYSYKIAYRLIKEHPLTGVGAGDIMDEMKRGYAQWHPQVVEGSILIPHNQFLVVALGCGIPAMLVFMAWVFMPLFWLKKNRQSFFFFVVWLILFFELMIEPVLEIQNGVFVFLFFLLLQLQEMRKAEVAPAELK
jgi:O-antigen ligase